LCVKKYYDKIEFVRRKKGILAEYMNMADIWNFFYKE